MRRHDTLVKWFFDNFRIFADSFSVASIRCVVRGLSAYTTITRYKTLSYSLLQCGTIVTVIRVA